MYRKWSQQFRSMQVDTHMRMLSRIYQPINVIKNFYVKNINPLNVFLFIYNNNITKFANK